MTQRTGNGIEKKVNRKHRKRTNGMNETACVWVVNRPFGGLHAIKGKSIAE